MNIWNKFINIAYYWVRTFRDRKVYLGHQNIIYVNHNSVFEKLNYRYRIFKFSTLRNLGKLGENSEISELTKWCKENNCVYGWATETFQPDFDMTNTIVNTYLFIATLSDDTYTLIKLTWL
jgi:hypothetical protein